MSIEEMTVLESYYFVIVLGIELGKNYQGMLNMCVEVF